MCRMRPRGCTTEPRTEAAWRGNSLCGGMRWGPPPEQQEGRGKGEISSSPPPLQAREGRPIARASRGRKRARDRMESTCWRGLASLLANIPLMDAALPSSPQPDPGEQTERDGATGVSLSSAHPEQSASTDDSETLPDSHRIRRCTRKKSNPGHGKGRAFPSPPLFPFSSPLLLLRLSPPLFSF